MCKVMAMDLVNRARLLSVVLHSGQLDKGGMPYHLHPAWVASKCVDDDAKVVAYLHDTVEDAPNIMSVDKARTIFGDVVADALDAITKRKGETYNDYLFRVKQNPLARSVKVLDLTHNMDIKRIPNPTHKDMDRIEFKYAQARSYLLND